jgi:hypothetical protein
MIGPGIIIPLVLVAVAVPAGFALFKRYLASMSVSDADRAVSGARLTSSALHRLPQPPWRVVYEIAPSALGGIDHVLIGPGGIFAVITEVAPLPTIDDAGDPVRSMAEAAVARADLDDSLRRCAMESTARLAVHWGRSNDDETCVELAHGALAVSGQRLAEWLATLPADRLTPAQVDLAWQTVVTAIGRPDPLR